jgi:hypothetical protein
MVVRRGNEKGPRRNIGAKCISILGILNNVGKIIARANIEYYYYATQTPNFAAY